VIAALVGLDAYGEQNFLASLVQLHFQDVPPSETNKLFLAIANRLKYFPIGSGTFQHTMGSWLPSPPYPRAPGFHLWSVPTMPAEFL
jgi:hypothetical protein